MAKSSGALVGINMLLRDVVMVVAGSVDEYNTKRKILTRKEVKCNACRLPKLVRTFSQKAKIGDFVHNRIVRGPAVQ